VSHRGSAIFPLTSGIADVLYFSGKAECALLMKSTVSSKGQITLPAEVRTFTFQGRLILGNGS